MSGPVHQRSLPRRDFVLLPLISLLTALLLAGSAELIARTFWQEHFDFSCTYRDAAGETRHKANCTEHSKNTEGPWITYEFNDCGYRNPEPCGAKPPSTVRIALIGTSVALGAYTPYSDLVSTRAQAPLAKLWNSSVEFQNLGEVGPPFAELYGLSDEVIALQPDLVIFLVMPYDLKRFDDGLQVPQEQAPDLLGYLRNLQDRLRSSRAAEVAMSHLLEQENFALNTYMKSADAMDITRVPVSEHLEQQFVKLSCLIGKIKTRLQKARVPLLVFPIPNRKEAAFLCRHICNASIDGAVFTRRAGEICRKQNVDFIDVAPALSRVERAEQLYYPLDGHLNSKGNRFLAEQLVAYFRDHALTTSAGQN